jgi:hypothetical protein
MIPIDCPQNPEGAVNDSGKLDQIISDQHWQSELIKMIKTAFCVSQKRIHEMIMSFQTGHPINHNLGYRNRLWTPFAVSSNSKPYKTLPPDGVNSTQF